MSPNHRHSGKEVQSIYKKRTPAELAKLRATIKRMGPHLHEKIREAIKKEVARRQQEKELKKEPKPKLRPLSIFYQALVNLNAGRAKKTTSNYLRALTIPWDVAETPEDMKDWYAKIHGDFAKPPLADLTAAISLYMIKNDLKLIELLYEAILKGDLQWLDQFVSCVAFIHKIPYAGNGQSRRMACVTAEKIYRAFTELYGRRGPRPSVTEIRVKMAHDACFKKNKDTTPKFSQIWKLLRAGLKSSGNDEVGHGARYEIPGRENIQKHLKKLKMEPRKSALGRLSVKKVKEMLNTYQMFYVDDWKRVT